MSGRMLPDKSRGLRKLHTQGSAFLPTKHIITAPKIQYRTAAIVLKGLPEPRILGRKSHETFKPVGMNQNRRQLACAF